MATHYDTLGVDPTASVDDVRAAYLAAARRCHPDTATGSEAQMRAVNAAWLVLSDPVQREEYDLTLPHIGGTSAAPRRATNRPDTTWSPIDDSDDVDPRDLIDDDGDPRTAPGKLGLVPVVLGAITFGVGMLAILTGERGLFTAVLMLVLLTFVSILAVPMAVLARSVAVERDADRRRAGD